MFTKANKTPDSPLYAKKTSEGEKLIITRLPAYNPRKDTHLTDRADNYFYEHEKESLRKVVKLVVDKDEFYMEDKAGKRVYEIRYEAIDKIMHKKRGKPVHIYAKDKKSFSDRIPFPTWSAEFNADILEAIAMRAGLKEITKTQEFRGASVYYGRE